MITTRDLFNYLNPARIYSKWLKDEGLSEGELSPQHPWYSAVSYAVDNNVLLQGKHMKGQDDEIHPK